MQILQENVLEISVKFFSEYTIFPVIPLTHVSENIYKITRFYNSKKL